MGGRMSNVVYAVSQHDDLRSIIAHNQTTKNRVSARWNRTDRTIDLQFPSVCLSWWTNTRTKKRNHHINQQKQRAVHTTTHHTIRQRRHQERFQVHLLHSLCTMPFKKQSLYCPEERHERVRTVPSPDSVRNETGPSPRPGLTSQSHRRPRLTRSHSDSTKHGHRLIGSSLHHRGTTATAATSTTLLNQSNYGHNRRDSHKQTQRHAVVIHSTKNQNPLYGSNNFHALTRTSSKRRFTSMAGGTSRTSLRKTLYRSHSARGLLSSQ